MFWIAATILVMVTMVMVYRPLVNLPKAETTRAALANALAAELAEIENDNGQRFADAQEAAAARAEVGRRLLKLQPKVAEMSMIKQKPLLGLFALLPIFSVPLYLQIGQPEYADQRFATRLDKEGMNGEIEIAQLVERVEQRLKDVPQDGQGWALIAPIYFRMNRVDDAVMAYGKALEFHKGDAVSRSRLLADKAEIGVVKENGTVTSDAAAGFSAALMADPENQKALFYMAVQREQSGNNKDDARANWQALIARFETLNPPWLAVAKQRLTALGDGQGNAVTPVTGQPARVGPSVADVEAAKEMTPQQRQDMITGMVEGLAARLKENPKDSAGWVRLINARIVMQNKPQALLDLETARKTFANGSPQRAEIDAVATSLGL